MNKKGLGKGLGAIFGDAADPVNTAVEPVRSDEEKKELLLKDIVPNPHQPRQVFDAVKLAELVESIKLHGVIQPLVVRKHGRKYEIVAGERRWRASKEAKLKTVPVIIRDYDDATMMEIALVENIQRHDLNPLEEAEGIKRLMTECKLTQEDAAKKVGRSRTAVANLLRLLNLPQQIREYVSRETLTMGQVKPLLSLDNEKQQLEVAAAIIEKGWSSRTVEDVVKELKTGRRFKVTEEAVIVAEEKANNKKGKAAAAGDVFTSDFQNRLVELLGTKVKVVPKDEKKGKIEIEYYSPEDLARAALTGRGIMVGLGTLVNSGAILAGAGAGLLLRRGLPEKWQESIMQGVALCIIVIGVQMAFKSENIMVVIFSIVLGAIVGEGIDIDTKLQRFGDWIGSKLIGGHDAGAAKAIGEGFVAASLIYCVGAMAIIGSLQDGLKGDTTILFAKSTLDGIIAIILTANLGIGVALSAVSVLLYQGTLTLLAGVLEPVLTTSILNEVTATGGMLIMAIGVNMLKVVQIRISNLLPAVLWAGIIVAVSGLL